MANLHRKFLIISLLFSVLFQVSVFASDKPVSLTSNLGIKILFMKEQSAPLVHIKIIFRWAGAAHMEKTKTSLPMFYSSAVICGCGENSSAQLRQKLINMSSNFSCSADCDNICFSMTVPKLALPEAVLLLNDIIRRPNFEEKETRIIQTNIAYGLQNYAIDPVRFACKMFIPSVIFQGHAYENGDCGNFEETMKLSVEDLRAYKSKFLVVNNAEACIFGDVSENEAKDLLDKVFAGVDKGKCANCKIKNVYPKLNSEVKKYNMVGPQSTVVFALKSVKLTSPKRYALFILYNILGGPVFRSRIMSELRKKQGYIYFGYVNFVDLCNANYAYGILQTDNSKVEKAISFLRSIVKDLREKGISKSDLDFAKDNIKGRLPVGLRTSGDLCDYYFNKLKLFAADKTLDDVLNGISSVKLEEVNTLAKEILDENNMPFILIGGNE